MNHQPDGIQQPRNFVLHHFMDGWKAAHVGDPARLSEAEKRELQARFDADLTAAQAAHEQEQRTIRRRNKRLFTSMELQQRIELVDHVVIGAPDPDRLHPWTSLQALGYFYSS